MNDNKRIWKTGALAVAVTIVFALFAFRAADWSRGLTSGFVVLGQTSSGGTGGSTGGSGSTGCTTSGSGSGAGLVTITKVIPQIAAGSFDNGITNYTTVIQIVNTSGNGNIINANFYKEDGTALTNVTLTAGTSSVTTGVLSSVTVLKDAVYVISGGGTSAAGAVGWGKITSCGSLTVSTFFELRDGVTKVVLGRVGVAASQANMTSFVIPRVRDISTGLDVGFALVNTGTTSANLTAVLKDAGGNTLGTQTVTMGAGAHQAKFTQQFFGLTNEPTGRNYSYITFTGTSASFAATALAFEGANQSSFPVDVLQ
jgi:hypothetical protein